MTHDGIHKPMRAVAISTPGSPGVLRVEPRAVPQCGPDEVLIRVEGAGVNRPDLLQRLGRYPPPPGASDLPGLEVAGTIEQTGSGVVRWRVGDRVCALLAGGGYAEYCVAPESQCLPVPDGMDSIHAAAVPETYFTVWTNLFERAKLARGERVLIHGGTSGIGTTAIQLARAFGAVPIATAGSDEKCAACERLGAQSINYRTTDFVPAVSALTAGRGVDVILDIVGGDYLGRNLQCLAVDGRLAQIGLQGGAQAQINLGLLLQRRLTLTGSTLRPRTPEEKGAIARELESHVWPLLAAGEVSPLVAEVFPLERAADAHRALESGAVIGKVVLTV
jgi:putative PIG3 family NAD(P)H quinone oxidoreductase